MRVDKELFLLPAERLAPLLLGKILCRQTEAGVLRVRITETECYCGDDDTACHARRGITAANKSLFCEGGVAYVYLCYGIHCLFNVVSGAEGHGEGVLIRGVEGASGPGRVSKLLKIGRNMDGHDLCSSSELWLEDDGAAPKYITLPRIGIPYAAPKDQARLWRFLVNSKA